MTTNRPGGTVPFEGNSLRPTVDPERITLVSILTLLLRHWKTLVLVPFAAAVLAVGGAIVLGRDHIAYSTIVPESSSGNSPRFAGLAAQFGVSLAPGGSGESAAFYAKLIRSRELLGELALTEYHLSAGRGKGEAISGNLLDLYEVKGDSHEDRMKSVIEHLLRAVSATVDRETSIITVATRARWPELAVQMNDRILTLVNEYNLERRQTTAAAEREFIEKRREQAQRELLEAEAELEEFLAQNRTFNSPQLRFENTRLQRRVDLRQQVFNSLAQAYEQARIDEVRNTPVITVLERPEGSTKPTPRLFLILFVSTALGCIAAVTIVAVREYMAWHRVAAPDEHREFQDALRSTAPLGLLRREGRKVRAG